MSGLISHLVAVALNRRSNSVVGLTYRRVKRNLIVTTFCTDRDVLEIVFFNIALPRILYIVQFDRRVIKN